MTPPPPSHRLRRSLARPGLERAEPLPGAGGREPLLAARGSGPVTGPGDEGRLRLALGRVVVAGVLDRLVSEVFSNPSRSVILSGD